VIMNVVTKSKKNIPKIKTFAGDLAANRGANHVPKKSISTLTQDDLNKKNNQPFNKKNILTPVKKKDSLVKNHDYYPPINPPQKIARLPKVIQPPIQNSLTSATREAIVSISDKNNGRDQSYDAVIITDTKHNRFHLIAEIKKALQFWWEKKLTKYAENKKPKYTIPQAERRKGVIQKATSSTGRTISVDHDAVLERIKASKHLVLPKSSITEQDKKYSILQNSFNNEKEATWSKTTKTDTDLKQETVSPETKTIPAKIISSKIPVPPIVPVASVPPVKIIKPKTPMVPVVPVIPATPSIPLVGENKNSDTEISLANNLPNEKKDDQLIVPQIKIVKSNLNKRDNNHLASRLMTLLRDLMPLKNIKLFVLVTLMLTTIGFIIYVGINTLKATPTTSQSKNNYSSALFNTAIQYHDILVEKDKLSIFAQIQTRNNPAESVTEINFILPQSNEVITAPALLPLFGFNLAPDFVSSLGKITFGFYHNEPWLVITTNNKTTAQGGLLRWETNMNNDLDPLFGSIIIARQPKTFSLTGFKDSLINNLDVRILFDDDKKEKLVYGFVSSDYILITTNTMAWLNLSTNFNQPQ